MTRAEVLLAGVRAAIRHHCPRSRISVHAWGETYSLPMKTIREVWEAELTKSTNANEGGEGK